MRYKTAWSVTYLKKRITKEITVVREIYFTLGENKGCTFLMKANSKRWSIYVRDRKDTVYITFSSLVSFMSLYDIHARSMKRQKTSLASPSESLGRDFAAVSKTSFHEA